MLRPNAVIKWHIVVSKDTGEIEVHKGHGFATEFRTAMDLLGDLLICGAHMAMAISWAGKRGPCHIQTDVETLPDFEAAVYCVR